MTLGLKSMTDNTKEICPCCGEERECFSYHRGTAYLVDELNYSYACEECIEYDKEAVKEAWAGYYSSVRGY